METAVEVRKGAELAPAQAGWGLGQDVLPSSVLAPRIHLMQSVSKLVTEGKCAVGDIAKLPGGQVITKKGGPFKVVPFGLLESWLLEEKVGKKFEFREKIVRNRQNDGLPWEFQQNGTEWKRTKLQEYFVLPLDEIGRELKAFEKMKKGEMPNPDDALLPSVISFKSFSSNAGKEIGTYFEKAKHYKCPLFYAVFEISAKTITHNGNTFWVYEVKKAEDTPKEYWPVCAKWRETLEGGLLRAIEEEAEASGEPAAEARPVNSSDDRF